MFPPSEGSTFSYHMGLGWDVTVAIAPEVGEGGFGGVIRGVIADYFKLPSIFLPSIMAASSTFISALTPSSLKYRRATAASSTCSVISGVGRF